ncbi:vav isoform X2 [Brachionus plicatilis]|uniref:Vav isoform X2 n=1 Tax=Brachionus plicatilis TaxID=10195 RepID=A0A3M7STA9_BRAPC|nr:vav isoform X2 [Brachionus plicatilis]
MSNQTNSNNDWIECIKWLNNLNSLPLGLKQKFLTNQLQLNEFASFLRDGEFLCNLVNQIVPGCIDSTLINKRAQMSQVLCLNNIRLFLSACKSARYFSMSDSDLFDEHMLYDLVDLACVIRTLSILSKNQLTIKSANTNGFDITNSSSGTLSKSDSSSRRLSSNGSLDTNQLAHTNDDIYYNIVPAEVEGPESYYTDESFLFNGLSDQQEKTDNQVYQTIVSTPINNVHHQPLKRDFVMKEILNTEKNFLDGLNILMNDFLIPLGNVLNEQDKKIIFTNMNGLIELHTNLYNDIYNACKV